MAAAAAAVNFTRLFLLMRMQCLPVPLWVSEAADQNFSTERDQQRKAAGWAPGYVSFIGRIPRGL
jgi:hypothetical protein